MLSHFISLSYRAHMPKTKQKNSTWDRKTLVSFPAGILVNGQLIGAKKPKNKNSAPILEAGILFPTWRCEGRNQHRDHLPDGGSRTSVLSWSDTVPCLVRGKYFYIWTQMWPRHMIPSTTQTSVIQRTQNHHFKCEEVRFRKNCVPSCPCSWQ